MITPFTDLINKESGRPFLVVGAGSSIAAYRDSIKAFIVKNNPVTIGINNISTFITPNYHVWTNTGRFREFGDTIHPLSQVILKKDMDPKLIRKHELTDYATLNYIDEPGVPVAYNPKKGRVEGSFRTAGCLSIFLSHLMGSGMVYVVGMDGYTYHGPEELDAGAGQHFYGTGFTDRGEMKDKRYWHLAAGKDAEVYKALDGISAYGVQFAIITPTVFDEYYEPLLSGEQR